MSLNHNLPNRTGPCWKTSTGLSATIDPCELTSIRKEKALQSLADLTFDKRLSATLTIKKELSWKQAH
jgi:hypothetical protein